MARKRHLSRIAVMQVLFQREYKQDLDIHGALKRNADELGDIDESFAKSLLEGTIAILDELTVSIQEYAPQWEFEEMDPIARPVLLLGAYELLYGNDAPPAVVMNECIEIAKEYGTDETGKFVNGVLNAIAKKQS